MLLYPLLQRGIASLGHGVRYGFAYLLQKPLSLSWLDDVIQVVGVHCNA